jgi:hypothetical protein
MTYIESKLPRLLATILLVVSVFMFGMLIDITVTLARGGNIPARAWLFPLAILATGAVLMWLLTRKGLALQLYVAAFALWLLTTGYYVANFRAMLP